MENAEIKKDPFTKLLEDFKSFGACGTVEILADEDHVSLPLSRYEELIHAEAELEIILRAYQNFDSYRLKDILVAVFGPLAEKGEQRHPNGTAAQPPVFNPQPEKGEGKA